MFWNASADQCSVWPALCENCGKKEAAAGTWSSRRDCSLCKLPGSACTPKAALQVQSGLFAEYITLSNSFGSGSLAGGFVCITKIIGCSFDI